jgi:hypothetical protein
MTVAEEREFQLEMVEAETSISNINLYLTLIVAIAYSLLGVLWAITSGANSVLNGSTVVSGNLTGGGTNYSGQVVIPLTKAIAFFSNLKSFEYVLGTVGTICLILIVLHQSYLAPKRFKKIRRKFIHLSKDSN